MTHFLRKIEKLSYYQIWIRDKKPKKLDQMIGNKDICLIFQKYIDNDNIPNVILSGDHGTCKRTIAHIVAKQYLNDSFNSETCLEINGSIYRGKDVISTGNVPKNSSTPECNITDFVRRKSVITGYKQKIIIINNFDSMTLEAQNSLRTIMEKYALDTRFILICNNTSDIIEAIQSRCIQLKTSNADYYESDELITSIISDINPEIKHLINILSDGDYKKIINFLQIVNTGIESPSAFYKLFNITPISVIENLLLKICRNEDIFQDIQNDIIDKGYEYISIVDITCKVLLFQDLGPEISRDLQYKWLEIISQRYIKVKHISGPIQIFDLFSSLYRFEAED
jgi:DNA polymerase III delta prime subunit